MNDDNLAAFGNATATAALVDAATGHEYGRVETDGTTCTVYAPDDSNHAYRFALLANIGALIDSAIMALLTPEKIEESVQLDLALDEPEQDKQPLTAPSHLRVLH